MSSSNLSRQVVLPHTTRPYSSRGWGGAFLLPILVHTPLLDLSGTPPAATRRHTCACLDLHSSGTHLPRSSTQGRCPQQTPRSRAACLLLHFPCRTCMASSLPPCAALHTRTLLQPPDPSTRAGLLPPSAALFFTWRGASAWPRRWAGGCTWVAWAGPSSSAPPRTSC